MANIPAAGSAGAGLDCMDPAGCSFAVQDCCSRNLAADPAGLGPVGLGPAGRSNLAPT